MRLPPWGLLFAMELDVRVTMYLIWEVHDTHWLCRAHLHMLYTIKNALLQVILGLDEY